MTYKAQLLDNGAQRAVQNILCPPPPLIFSGVGGWVIY